jgi:hypothetical protein
VILWTAKIGEWFTIPKYIKASGFKLLAQSANIFGETLNIEELACSQ